MQLIQSFKNILSWEEEIKKQKEEKFPKDLSVKAARQKRTGKRKKKKRKKNKYEVQAIAANLSLMVRASQGANLSISHLLSEVFVYRILSCKRLILPCQNSIVEGSTR